MGDRAAKDALFEGIALMVKAFASPVRLELLDRIAALSQRQKEVMKLVEALESASKFFAHESCGQCTPCRVGTVKALQLMTQDRWDGPLLDELSQAFTRFTELMLKDAPAEWRQQVQDRIEDLVALKKRSSGKTPRKKAPEILLLPAEPPPGKSRDSVILSGPGQARPDSVIGSGPGQAGPDSAQQEQMEQTES